MDNRTVAEKVKLLIGQAETETALQELIAYLKTDARWNSLEQAATEAQAQFLNAKREANAGRISFEQADLIYNRVNNRTLQIAEDIEQGNTRGRQTEPARQGFKLRAWMWGAMALALLIAVFAIYKWSVSNAGTQGGPVVAGECPVFADQTEFRILLWEYQAFLQADKEAAKGVPVALQNRLNTSIQRDWPVETRIFGIKESVPYPARQEEALKCGAQLAIWGTAEKIAAQQWVVITSYAFSDKWRLSRWNMTGGEQWEKTEVTATLPLEGSFVDTISSLSSIFTQGKVAVNIEALLKIAIGLNATRAQDQAKAIASLENMAPQDSTLALLGGMLLAENYAEAGKEDKAAGAYEKVLSVHPNYALALNNYAALQIKQGDYGGAIATLDNALATAPNNPEALAMRGSVFLEVNQLDLAQRDLSKAKELITRKASAPIKAVPAESVRQSKILEEQFSILKEKVEFEKRRKTEAEQELRRNPENVDALNARAEASKNLGDHRTAIQTANTAIQKQPENLQAHATLVESLIAIGDTARLRDALKRAERIGIEPAAIKDSAPLIKTLPDTLLFRRRIN